MIALRKYLLAGVVAMMPLLVVVALVNWLIGLSDKTLALLPRAYQPEIVFGVNVPGMGILLALLFILLIGALTSHFIGRWMMRMLDQGMARIPLVRTVYKATSQLLEAMFGDNSNAFKEVVMVPFPHPDSMVLGFVTGASPARPDSDSVHGSSVAVFVPSTPLPTTGWLLFVETDKLVHLDMSVEDGMKLVLSGGAVTTPNESVQ